MKPTRKILIVATRKWTKKQEAEHVKEAIEIMMAGNAFSKVTIDIDYRDFGKPETYLDAEGERRITHDWFERNISHYAKAAGYHSSRLRISKSEGRKWDLKSGIRGVNYSDNPNDFHGEGWIVTDSRSRVRFEDGTSRDLAPKVTAHEEGHELKHAGLTDLNIHDYDFQNSINNIEEFYRRLVIQWPYIDMATFLRQIIAQLLLRAVYPIPKEYILKPSQGYLKPNKMYKSGVHNGADFPAPPDTPVRAPLDAVLYLSGKTKELGYFAFLECDLAGEKTYHLFPHLVAEPRPGKYKKGSIFGQVGNTGLSTGPHLHWTILSVKPVSVSHYVSLVDTAAKVIKNTVDPYLWALYHVDRIKT